MNSLFRISRRSRSAVALAVVALGLAPGRASSQEKTTALLGAGIGGLAGAYVSAAVVVSNARFGNYRFSYDEISWELIPIPAMAVTTAVIGYQERNRMWKGILWGSLGFAGGTGVGALLGRVAWGEGSGQWAGGVIGGAVGILAGGTLGWFAWEDEGEGDGAPVDLTLGTVTLPW